MSEQRGESEEGRDAFEAYVVGEQPLPRWIDLGADVRRKWARAERRIMDREGIAYREIAMVCEEHIRGDLRQVRADLAAETATRTALRTQEARISGLLADARVPVGDLVAGVAALVAGLGMAKRACADAVAERDEMRSARDVLLAEVDRLRARLADAEARAEGLDVTEHHGVAR